jgi:UDPglucose 6-dehydrogenase
MQIGMIGLGKLGLPCALAMELRGHTVVGLDPAPLTQRILETKQLAYCEQDAQPLLEQSRIRLVGRPELVRTADLIFIAVQTPHAPQYEGITPIPDTRADFDYANLCMAVQDLCRELVAQDCEQDVVIISTVLPGTIEKYIRPIIASYGLTGRLRLAYNPFFIAMGTTIPDFLNPEFSLLGVDDPRTADKVALFYSTIHTAAVRRMTVEEAELTKVLYNTFIGTKIAFGNTVMELCHKTPNTNCDVVIDALSAASGRLISGKYLRGGMGDGGGCHPRDNIALSWLANKLNLSHDLFFDIMKCREDQTKWLVELIRDQHVATGLSVVLLGTAFKPNTNITTGSPARLLAHYLKTNSSIPFIQYDPCVNAADPPPRSRACYFVSTQHEDWEVFNFPAGSVVIDPFRYLQDNPSIAECRYIPIGVKHAVRHPHPVPRPSGPPPQDD